jgi:UDP-N-acetylmuramoyl-tripeptide--D-alanyl-D-alanine ligase
MSAFIEQLYSVYLNNPAVQTDTRKLQSGEIFFALKGDNFNGNTFAAKALELGAAAVVVDEEVNISDKRIFKVTNALEALQQLAKHHRQQFNIPFIAITGSNGKTTSKELVSAVLASHYKTYTTKGNLNNHIGVPLTLLSIKSDAEMAVIEMGANHQKEIAGYCTYTLPTHGLITNCGKAHLEGFGGVEGVKKGKGELFDFLRANNGTAFVYWDFDYLQQMCKGIKEIIKYGTTEGFVIGKVKASNPFLSVEITSEFSEPIIQTQLVGDYNVSNILTAVTIGKYFNVPDEKIKSAIENYSPSNSRSQLIKKDSNQIILDAYNANPTSMKAAIENFANIEAEQKVLMIGGMMELGDESIEEHQKIIHLIQQYSWKQVVLVGGDFKKLTTPFLFLNTSIEAKEWFKQQQFSNTTILIKGSRSTAMERVLED